MKKCLILLALFVCACDRTDVRIQAANILYNTCLQNGENAQWCRCLRADLIDAKKAFTEEMANYVVNDRQHPWLNTTLLGARVRCECRMYPRHVAMYGVSCAGVNDINF